MPRRPDSIVPLSQEFADALTEKFSKIEKPSFYTPIPPSVVKALPSTEKYDKLTIKSGHSNPDSLGSAFAFIERETGLLYMAASWSKPANGARYDLNGEENFAHVVEVADEYGGFLYKTKAESYKLYPEIPTYKNTPERQNVKGY